MNDKDFSSTHIPTNWGGDDEGIESEDDMRYFQPEPEPKTEDELIKEKAKALADKWKTK